MSASFRIRYKIPAIYVIKRGKNVLKTFVNLKYRIHLFLHYYNEALIQDALCEKLQAHLKQKASYHRQQAKLLMTRI
jgi:hypothetical protein